MRGDRNDAWKGDQTIVNHFHGVSSTPEARRDVSITILLYPMTSSAVAPIQDNTQRHSSATLRTRLVMSVGLNENSYTAKARRCLLATSSSISKKHREGVHHMLPWVAFKCTCRNSLGMDAQKVFERARRRNCQEEVGYFVVQVLLSPK